MVDSDANTIRLEDSNIKCPFRLKKSYSVALKPEHPVNQERPRSNSHISFNCRPEFVPKPKPKATNVNPSPMKLCRKISPNVSNSGIEYECMSCPDSDNELSYSEETQPFSQIEDDSNAVNELRKEMMKIRTSTQDEKISNEYESVLKIDDLLNEEKRKKKKAKSIWKKHIQKQEEKSWLYQSCDNSGRRTVSTHSNLSILGILESAVKEKVSLRQSSIY